MSNGRNYQKEILEICEIRPIAYNPVLAKAVKSVTAGLLLSQMLFWKDKGSKQGWVYKTIAEMEQETALSRQEQDTAIRKLKALGILETKLIGVPAKRHFRVNYDAVLKLLQNHFTLQKSHKADCSNPANYNEEMPQTITDTTTETTTRNSVLHTTAYAEENSSHEERTVKEENGDRQVTPPLSACIPLTPDENGKFPYDAYTPVVKAYEEVRGYKVGEDQDRILFFTAVKRAFIGGVSVSELVELTKRTPDFYTINQIVNEALGIEHNSINSGC